MEQFKYSPLEPELIRLLTLLPESTSSNIRCSIQHRSYTEAASSYIALSYAWGDPTPVTNIVANGCSLGVARNLHAWFQAIQRPVESDDATIQSKLQTRTFWIDALCINQQDIAERNAQVRLMWRVYSSAQSVLAWLGPPTPLLSDAFELAGAMEDVPGSMLEDLAPAICDALDSSGYFSRVWIVPEILSGSVVWLMSGSLTLSWESMLLFLDEGTRWGGSSRDPIRDYSSPLPPGCRGLVALAWQEEESRFQRDFNKAERFTAHLRALAERGCADVRDKVFALAAVPQSQDALKYVERDCLVVDYGLSAVEVGVMTLACLEQIHRTDPADLRPDAWVHREVLEAVLLALEIEVPRMRAWLRANTRGKEIWLSSGKRIDAGPILLDLLGEGMLLRDEGSIDFRVYERHLVRHFGVPKWRTSDVPGQMRVGENFRGHFHPD